MAALEFRNNKAYSETKGRYTIEQNSHTLSTLIAKLQATLDEHGDLPVVIKYIPHWSDSREVDALWNGEGEQTLYEVTDAVDLRRYDKTREVAGALADLIAENDAKVVVFETEDIS